MGEELEKAVAANDLDGLQCALSKAVAAGLSGRLVEAAQVRLSLQRAHVPQFVRTPLHSRIVSPRLSGLVDFQSATILEVRDFSALPSEVWSGTCDSSDADSSEKPSCQICIEGFACGQEVTRLPCLHLFHSHCVQQWLRRSNA